MDAIVIGAGIIGASIAWRLRRKGMTVALLEAGTAGCEASGASAGMLAPGGEFGADSPWTRRALESLSLWPGFVSELREQSGLPVDYRACGAMDLAYTEAEWLELQGRAAQQATAGIRWQKASDTEVERYCRPGFMGALYYPEDAIVDPREVMAALRVICKVFLHEGVAVRGVDLKPESVAVQTASETLEAKYVVLAAGAWSSSVFASGPESFAVKGQLNGYHLPGGSLGPVLRRGHTYVFQRTSGYTIAGSTTERNGVERTVNPDLTADIHRRATAFISSLQQVPVADAWCGLRPATAALEPEVRRVVGSNLWLAYGHYRNGVLLAPVTSKVVAGEIGL